MRRHLVLAGALALVVGLLPFQAVAAADPVHTGTVSPGTPFAWTGTLASGTNTGYDSATGEPCAQDALDPSTYCDTLLLRVDVDPSYWDTHGGGVQIRLFGYFPSAASDFDFYVYASDAAGTRGAFLKSSTGLPAANEATTIPNASGYYLVQVVYFAVTASQYSGEAAFVSHGQIPPDVDAPAGLQEYLASDPAIGFRSYSEPHIAVSPRDPNVMVAGSKFYNKDADSLAQYEFKIGTFVTFDGGRTWTTLGQIAACPLAEAPAETWPDENTCYPEDDPALDDDPGEEYIVSDIWLQFDDEGNAYAMVLDAPPLPSGLGWGMTLHRWESVSPEDLATGDTWSERLPINLYADSLKQGMFLDDKNTFAVNNAGADGDGETGVLIACWGQNLQVPVPGVITVPKQQIVCERSTDAGRTWPGEPLPISGADALAIGVHVVADPNDENAFYAVWLQYASGLVGPATMHFSRTLDGGLTWTVPTVVTSLQGVPRQYPGQSFRNLSIPIMAVGPAGDLYVAYADYRPATEPGDADGRQADIMLARGLLGGAVWLPSVKVNGDAGNADQFQPYVEVSPAGDVYAIYFDRRHDPENFFIDSYLSKSTDGGATFTDTRLSHDPWDPTINPPISSSGDFIGDYQGLVVTECTAVPFVNDTHLANDPARDPEFDGGMPRSVYQDVSAWRVPTGDCAAPVTARVNGGGDVPGRNGAGVATFGINVRQTSSGARGSFSVSDSGTGQVIESRGIDSIERDGSGATIHAFCSVDGGPASSCVVEVHDGGTPGKGVDELRITAGSYAGGGTLLRGNVHIR